MQILQKKNSDELFEQNIHVTFENYTPKMKCINKNVFSN